MNTVLLVLTYIDTYIRKQGFQIDGFNGTVSVRKKDESDGELISLRSICVPLKTAIRVPCRLATVGRKPIFLLSQILNFLMESLISPSLLNEHKHGNVFAVCVWLWFSDSNFER